MDAETRRFYTNQKTLADITKQEGALASGLIELQQQDSPDDAVAEDMADAPGPYRKAVAEVLRMYNNLPKDIEYINLDQLGRSRGKYLTAASANATTDRRYNNAAMLAAMRRLLRMTRMGGVGMWNRKTPVVSFSPRLWDKYDDGGFTVIPMAKREQYNKRHGIAQGSTIVATDVNGMYVRGADGSIKLVRLPAKQ